jgi:NTP pyrophosphatase (non-canonical NTP hydrolase)
MLQLYGNPRSRAVRCLWMLEEVGELYQLLEKSTRAGDLQSDASLTSERLRGEASPLAAACREFRSFSRTGRRSLRR